MASEKLVCRNAEEREFWRAVFYKLCGSLLFPSDVGVTDATTAEAQADAAVLAYRERCGPELESLFMGTPLSKLNPDEKNKLRDILDLPPQPTRDEGPWAVWIPSVQEWRQYQPSSGEDMVLSSVLSFFDRKDADEEAERFDKECGDTKHCIVAPFPRTRAEFERGPGAVDEKIGGGE